MKAYDIAPVAEPAMLASALYEMVSDVSLEMVVAEINVQHSR